MDNRNENKDHPEQNNNGLRLGKRAILLSVIFMLLIMVITYVLTLVIPGGEFARTTDAEGHRIIDLNAGYTEVPGGIPFWKWLLSPLLVLGAEGSGTLIAIILFLLLIGGLFNALTEQGIMKHMLSRLVFRYGRVRYRLLAAVTFFFMVLGAFVGSFEEVIPMVPIVVTLAVGLGWDIQTGIAMSLLAVGCGFASGVANPFTVGIAQTLSGLPVFSGMWYRIIGFVLIYLLLVTFIYLHARKIARPGNSVSAQGMEAGADLKRDRGVRCFAIIMGIGIVIILLSGFIPAIADYSIIILSLTFAGAGVSSVLTSGMGLKRFGKFFVSGVAAIAPSIILILMASSIRYIMEEGHILDTILHFALQAGSGMSTGVLILFIYLICMVINFFVPSGSAEAFLLIPIIVPLASAFGVSSQLCIVAFAFGDGFSNIIYPTNAALLVSLGLAGCSYGKWVKYSLPFQLLNLVLTSGMLLLGVAVGYA